MYVSKKQTQFMREMQSKATKFWDEPGLVRPLSEACNGSGSIIVVVEAIMMMNGGG